MANLLLNFDSSNDEQSSQQSFRTLRSTQEVFERTFSDFLPDLANVSMEAFEMARKDFHSRSPSFSVPLSKSIRMQECWKGLLFDHFFDDMHFYKNKQMFFLQKSGYRFFFKKLRNDLKPMNNPTAASTNLLMQHQDKTIDIFVGYIPSKEWDEVKTLCAVYISRKSVVWVTDLKPFNQNGPLQLPLFPVLPDDGDGLVVKPKENRRNIDISANISG